MEDYTDLLGESEESQLLREKVDPAELRREGLEDLAATLVVCERELQRLQIEALKVADIVQDEIQTRRDEGYKPKLGLRVRVVNGTLQIVWYTNATSLAKVKGKITAQQLNKGGRRKFRYEKSTFSRFPEWERDNALMGEKHFEVIRRRASIVNNMRSWAKRYIKELEERNGYAPYVHLANTFLPHPLFIQNTTLDPACQCALRTTRQTLIRY